MADYYTILGLKNNASTNEIIAAYKKLSLKYHPNNNNNDPTSGNITLFTQLAEAYEVLSDPSKKYIYDMYGEEILKHGQSNKPNDQIYCYRFNGNPFEIFDQFFLNNNPFTDIIDSIHKKTMVQDCLEVYLVLHLEGQTIKIQMFL